MGLKSVIIITIVLPVLMFGCNTKENNILDKSADELVINYCKAIEAGKQDEAVSFLSILAKQELEKTGGKTSFAEATEAYKKHKGIKNINFTNRVTNGPLAAIKFIYTFNDGSTAEDSFPLIKENGKWKISK